MKQVGLIGLGKMGFNLALQMLDNQIEVHAYDKSQLSEKIESNHFFLVQSIRNLVETLHKPRLIWLMVPAGIITDTVMDELSNYLQSGDIVIDGGNSRYSDTIRRYNTLKQKGINLVDCGTSGGVLGARNGATFMVGGNREVVETCEWLFELLAIENGYAYVGEAGSGHYVKMIHNGIEYGMMQAIGEGFDLLNASQFDFDYEKIAKVWASGSIISGLLMDKVLSAFKKDKSLDSIEGRVDDSGEGQWTVEEALRLKVATPVISQALYSRYKSKDDLRFAEKVVSAMRNEFGGHEVYKKS